MNLIKESGISNYVEVIDDCIPNHEVEKYLAEATFRYFMQHKQEEFTQNVKKEAYRFSWDRMVETIEMF